MQCLLTYPQLQQLRFPKCCPKHGGIAAMSRGVTCCVQSQQKSSVAGFTPAKQQTPQVLNHLFFRWDTLIFFLALFLSARCY